MAAGHHLHWSRIASLNLSLSLHLSFTCTCTRTRTRTPRPAPAPARPPPHPSRPKPHPGPKQVSHHWLTPFKNAVLVPPRLRVLATTPTSATTARVTLRAEAAAAFVVLDSRNVPGAFDDGAFAMLPGVDVSLSFTARSPLSVQQWAVEFAGGLRVRSLRDTYA